MKQSLWVFVVSSVFVLLACEPNFVGDRAFDLTQINRPFQMREVEVNGQEYLAVVNTNYTTGLLTGSLHFYNLADPANPSRNVSLDLELPANASDFFVYEGGDAVERLFVLDRSDSKILHYQFDGTAFIPSSPRSFPTFENPQSLSYFQGDPNNTNYLAILCQTRGTLQFLNLDELSLFILEDLQDLLGQEDAQIQNVVEFLSLDRERLGSSFEMLTRETRIQGISGGETRGQGIGKVLTIEGGEIGPILVSASFTDEAIFGFRFNSFDNAANLLWDPREAIRGVNDTPGTGEEGFRGMDLDNAGFLYLSSRSDNRLYRVPSNLLEESRGGATNLSNTRAFGENETDYRLNLSFDADTTDTRFPRLSDLAVRPDGQRLYVIGLEAASRGFESSRVYLVNLTDPASPSLAATVELPAGERPQRLLYRADSQTLIVASTDANRLRIYDVSADRFDLLSTTQNN